MGNDYCVFMSHFCLSYNLVYLLDLCPSLDIRNVLFYLCPSLYLGHLFYLCHRYNLGHK